MKSLAILTVFVFLGIGSAAYLTTTPDTRTVSIEVPYQMPVYEDVNVSYQETIYKTVDKTTYVQKTETKYKDETRYRTVTRYGSVTYYSGWLQIVYASKIYFSKATSANCEPAGLSIGVSELYTCTIVGGPNAGTYTAVVLYNIDEETERVPQQVKEAYKVQVPYEVTVNVPETVQEQVIDHYETKYKTEKRIKGYETKYRTETKEITKSKFEWLFSSSTNSLVGNNAPTTSSKTINATGSSIPTQSTISLALTLKRLEVVEWQFNGNVFTAATAGLERTGHRQTFENGYYYVVDWQGDKYVALNGNTNELAKLILEQRKILKSDGTSYIEKKTLTTGEMWDVGGGWTLTAQAIDAKASPRQVWLVLNYKGVKKDDKVIAQGMIYTYVEKSIADESDVPLFMTYMDSVFVGATNDMAQFSYTWAISPSVEIIKPGDNFGGMEVVAVDNVNKRIELKKDNAQKISSITAIETPISTSKEKDLSIGETWNIGGGWTITVQSVDAMATPKQVWLVLYRNGNKLDDKVMAEGETYSYKNIFSTKVTRIYAGTTSDRVVLADTYTS